MPTFPPVKRFAVVPHAGSCPWASLISMKLKAISRHKINVAVLMIIFIGNSKY
jgi:hypothetical protein